jgi:hypothetical protein
VILKALAELDPAWPVPHELDELRPALDQRLCPQIAPVHVEDIEGDKAKPARFRLDRAADRIEVRRAMLIADDHLAVYDG